MARDHFNDRCAHHRSDHLDDTVHAHAYHFECRAHRVVDQLCSGDSAVDPPRAPYDERSYSHLFDVFSAMALDANRSDLCDCRGDVDSL